MVEEPLHVKQLSLNHVCKIGLKVAYVCFQLASTFKYKEPSHEIFLKFSIQINIHFIDEFADGFKTKIFND
jgi:hypothetical protein